MCDNVSFLGRKRGKEEELLWTDAKSDKHIFTHTHKYSHMNNLTCCTFIFFCKKNWLDIFTRDSYRWKFRKAVCYYVIFVLPPNNQQVSPSSLTSFKGDFVETLLRCSVQMIMNNFWSPFWSQINYVQFSRCKTKK